MVAEALGMIGEKVKQAKETETKTRGAKEREEGMRRQLLGVGEICGFSALSLP